MKASLTLDLITDKQISEPMLFTIAQRLLDCCMNTIQEKEYWGFSKSAFGLISNTDDNTKAMSFVLLGDEVTVNLPEDRRM